MRKRKMCMIGGEADYALEAAKLRSRRLVYGKIGVQGDYTCQAYAECNNTCPACQNVLRYYEIHKATVKSIGILYVFEVWEGSVFLDNNTGNLTNVTTRNDAKILITITGFMTL